MPERRIALDGVAYTRAEFAEWSHGEALERAWERARIATEPAGSGLPFAAEAAADGIWGRVPRPPPPPSRSQASSATEVATSAPPPPPPPPPPQTTSATEADVVGTSSAPEGVATEHALVVTQVLLSQADIPLLVAAEHSRRPPRHLHNLAREALNAITVSGPQGGLVRDLSDCFPWEAYIAHHRDAPNIVGTGVTRAVAEFSDTTTDPNRGGLPRLDFVFYHADGHWVRLQSIHPAAAASVMRVTSLH